MAVLLKIVRREPEKDGRRYHEADACGGRSRGDDDHDRGQHETDPEGQVQVRVAPAALRFRPFAPLQLAHHASQPLTTRPTDVRRYSRPGHPRCKWAPSLRVPLNAFFVEWCGLSGERGLEVF